MKRASAFTPATVFDPEPSRLRTEPGAIHPAYVSGRAPATTLSALLTLEQLSQLLQLHERTIRRLVAGGRMPCLRLGRTVRFDPADVARWLAARKEG